VIALTTTRKRWTRYLATLLLVLQGLAGGAVSLAHASERLTAPVHIEAQHSSACVALHDELRCALCHYAGLRVLPQTARRTPAATDSIERRPPQVPLNWHGDPSHLSAPPRAPPAFYL
jgi:hypothetical protein